jgi:hypothetical protein
VNNVSLHDQAARVLAAFRALVDAAAADCRGEVSQPVLPLRVPLEWRPELTATELLETVLRNVQEAQAQSATLRGGHVYCYACRSASCEHSHPPRPGEVFAGYTSLGLPAWDEFLSCLLAWNDLRADQLFSERPEILAHLTGRARLIQNQLSSFGKDSITFRIWGQVSAGYFRIGEAKTALTAQVVETKDRSLRLLVVADACLLEALADTPENHRSPLFRAYDALQEARTRIAAICPRWQHAEHRATLHEEVNREVFAVLRHLARSLERQGRQEHRRTVHAETRSQQARPVSAGPDDVSQAQRADFFRDVVRQSIVVAGRGGRCHVYTENGRHITTLAINGKELEGRVRRRRYQPLTGEEYAAFRKSLASGA